MLKPGKIYDLGGGIAPQVDVPTAVKCLLVNRRIARLLLEITYCIIMHPTLQIVSSGMIICTLDHLKFKYFFSTSLYESHDERLRVGPRSKEDHANMRWHPPDCSSAQPPSGTAKYVDSTG